MKQCPSCRTTYSDETLSFCLDDGTPLIQMAEQVTVVRSGRSDPMRVEIPQSAAPDTQFTPVHTQTQGSPEKESNTMKIVLVVGLLGAMTVAAVGGAAALIYFNKDARVAEPTGNNTKGTPTPTPDNTNELRDQIANLEKRLNEQKNTNKPGVTPPLVMPSPSTTQITARANSPRDGFLALRSLPSSEIGERLVKIPHGAAVSIGGCGVRVGRGRWCQASYNGYSGWVFDAYLTY